MLFNNLNLADQHADQLAAIPADKILERLNSNSLIQKGGSEQYGGDSMLFLPLAILFSKDVNKFMQIFEKLTIEYIIKWFNDLSKLYNNANICSKFIYGKTWLPIQNDIGPTYFNYVI